MAIKGGCLCDKVRYETNGRLFNADHCHCSMCRRQHGAAFATYADFNPDDFKWTSGQDLVKVYETSSGAGWCFCSECGSSLAGTINGKVTSITLGSVEGDPGIKLEAHIFVGSKAQWYDITDDLPQFDERPQTKRFYHGTRAELKPEDLIEPSLSERDEMTAYVYLTPDLDAAIWEAELAIAEGSSRVYIVEAIGPVEDTSDRIDQKSLGHPSMSWRSREPLRVMGEVTQWPLYHGTRADLQPGELIQPGHTPNFGNRDRITPYVYFTRILDAATWGAELAAGEGSGRVYLVELTGPVEEDPNLTNQKFRDNSTKSFRSRAPLRVIGEIIDWQGRSPEAVKAMQDGLKQLEQLGIEPIDD